MAVVRDEMLRIAARLEDPRCSEIRTELDSLGPAGLWCEAVRSILADHAFVRTDDESFAETVARSLDIGTDELRVCIAQGQIGSALLDRFREPRETTDNVRSQVKASSQSAAPGRPPMGSPMSRKALFSGHMRRERPGEAKKRGVGAKAKAPHRFREEGRDTRIERVGLSNGSSWKQLLRDASDYGARVCDDDFHLVPVAINGEERLR